MSLNKYSKEELQEELNKRECEKIRKEQLCLVEDVLVKLKKIRIRLLDGKGIDHRDYDSLLSVVFYNLEE